MAGGSMQRMHLFEIEDQAWCPDAIRDGITDLLRFIECIGKFYHPILPRLKRVLRELKSERVIDLCSGAGGPWVNLYRELDDLENRPVIYLTDLHPNRPAFDAIERISSSRIQFHAPPVDATNVPEQLTGFRTLFTSFHHFPPRAAKAVLHDAVRRREGVGIFEMNQRNFLNIILMCLGPFVVLLATPFLRPFRWWRLFLTYLIPAIPLALLFDGIVSCLRVYSPQELRDLTEGIPERNDYCWEIGIEPIGVPSLGITYLIGYPVPGKVTLAWETK